MPATFPPTFPIYLQGATSLDGALDHEASALGRLAQYLRDKPNVRTFLTKFTDQAQELETAFQELLSFRALDSAFGLGLDILGDIVGAPREGLSDDEYRTRIAARIKLNTSSGTVEEIYEIFSLIKPASSSLAIRDEFPAGFTLGIGAIAITADSAALLLKFLRLARAAGVRGIMEWGEADPADLFTFDGTADQTLDVGLFKGALI